MVTLILGCPAFVRVSGGPADKLVDHALTVPGSRTAVTGIAVGALSAPAQCKELTVASLTARVCGNTARIANTLARSKRQPSVGDPHATGTTKDTLGVTFIGAATTHATVLFADMRGFTGLAERLPCGRVVPLLNEFFAILARVTVSFGGQVFHMAGDGMMAGFGVQDSGRSGARAAFAAGDAMLQRFAPVAIRWRHEFDVVTGIGIGLNLGEVALGFLGPPGKKAITLIGDTVNVASRLCGRARAGEMLFSCAVAAALIADGDSTGVSNPKLPSLDPADLER